jgi:hypothetical protein
MKKQGYRLWKQCRPMPTGLLAVYARAAANDQRSYIRLMVSMFFSSLLKPSISRASYFRPIISLTIHAASLSHVTAIFPRLAYLPGKCHPSQFLPIRVFRVVCSPIHGRPKLTSAGRQYHAAKTPILLNLLMLPNFLC